MRLYRFDVDAGKPISAYGSVGLALTPILRPCAAEQIVVMWLAPGGCVGKHGAECPQLFLVCQGEGWVEGGDGKRQPICAGQAAWWSAEETHAAGTDTGMAVFVIEGDALDPVLLRPLE